MCKSSSSNLDKVSYIPGWLGICNKVKDDLEFLISVSTLNALNTQITGVSILNAQITGVSTVNAWITGVPYHIWLWSSPFCACFC